MRLQVSGISRRAVLATWAALLSVAATAALAAPPRSDTYDLADLEKLERTFQQVAYEVAPSVIALETFRELRRGGGAWVLNSQGSGFVYSADGLIVTNHHVIDGADRIEATVFGGDKYDAQIVQFDPRSDLAVLRIDAKNLRVAALGTLDDLRVGQWVFTAGNPFGLATQNGAASVAFGTVAAVGRSLTGDLQAEGRDRYYGNLIETVADINPGNSGGPLFNLHGQVVGVSTAMISKSGVHEGRGFAIPVSPRTRRIFEQLATGDVVRYGYLGVNVSDARRVGGQRGHRGALIESLARDIENGPAQRAGLRPRDVITQFDGKPVRSADDLIRLVGATPVGRAVPVEYYREGRRATLKVELVERRETTVARRRSRLDDQDLRHMEWHGLVVVEPTDALLSAHKLSRDDAGVFVYEVPRDTIFYRHGLRANTMIMRLNGSRVRSLDELLAREKETGGDLRLELANGTTILAPK